MSIHTHFYRNLDEVGLTPEQQAIADLQEDVERIDEKNDEQDARIEALEKKTYDHWIDSTTETRRYVDCLNGSDEEDGKTPESAYRTIDKALESLNSDFNSLFIILTTPGTYPFNYVKYLFSSVTLHIYGEKETGFTPNPGSYILQPVSRVAGTKTLTFYNSRLHFENCTIDNTIQGGSITIEGCSIYTSYVNWKCGGTSPYLVLNSSDYQGETITNTNCTVQLNNGAQAKFNGLTQNIAVAHSTNRALSVIYNSLCIVRNTHTVTGAYETLYYSYNSRLALQQLTISAPIKNISPVFSTIFAGESIRTELGYDTASELTLWVDKPRLISDLALKET